MKDRVIVEYTLSYTDKPIWVAEYHIVKKLPKVLKGEPAAAGQIEKLLNGMND